MFRSCSIIALTAATACVSTSDATKQVPREDTGPEPVKSTKLYTQFCDSVECKNADDESEYSSGDYESLTCTWYCTSKGSYSNEYVAYMWSRYDDDCFTLSSEYVSDGLCY